MGLAFSTKFCLKYASLQEEFKQLLSQIYVEHAKCPLFLSDFNDTWILSTDFLSILKYQFYEDSASGEEA
jgi:hypothetical protein